MHCTQAVQKAYQVLRSIRRSFKHINKQSFLILYKTFIRPHLEFAPQSWNPSLRKDIDLIEKVQQRATKMVSSLKNLDYNTRLQELGLTTLELRRQRGDMIEVYKLLNGHENIDASQFFKLNTNSNRGHSMKLIKPRSNLCLRQNFFSRRIVNHWNQLPQSVIDAESINSFKNRIDKFYYEKFKADRN